MRRGRVTQVRSSAAIALCLLTRPPTSAPLPRMLRRSSPKRVALGEGSSGGGGRPAADRVTRRIRDDMAPQVAAVCGRPERPGEHPPHCAPGPRPGAGLGDAAPPEGGHAGLGFMRTFQERHRKVLAGGGLRDGAGNATVLGILPDDGPRAPCPAAPNIPISTRIVSRRHDAGGPCAFPAAGCHTLAVSFGARNNGH